MNGMNLLCSTAFEVRFLSLLVMSYLALSSTNPCRDFLAALQALRVELSQLGNHVQMWDAVRKERRRVFFVFVSPSFRVRVEHHGFALRDDIHGSVRADRRVGLLINSQRSPRPLNTAVEPLTMLFKITMGRLHYLGALSTSSP